MCLKRRSVYVFEKYEIIMIKRLILLIGLVLASVAVPLFANYAVESVGAYRPEQSKVAPLSNDDVVGMVKAGRSADIVIAKIKASATDFDTSPAALQVLKSSNVPDVIILAMTQSSFDARKPNRVPN